MTAAAVQGRVASACLAALLLVGPCASAAPPVVEEDDVLLDPLDAALDPEDAEARLQRRREGLDLGAAPGLLEPLGLTPGETEAWQARPTARDPRDAGTAPRRESPRDGLAPDGLAPDGLASDGFASDGLASDDLPSDTARAERPVSGRIHLATAAASGDVLAPPVLLEADLHGPLGLGAGLELALARFRPAPPSWDPSLQALVTAGPGPRLEVSRAYLRWRRGRLRLIAGTFEAGFEERLVLDTTRTGTPDGFTLASSFRRPLRTTLGCHLAGPGRLEDPVCQAARLQTPDFLTREPFRGLAASLDGLDLGGGVTASVAAFASWQTRRLAQTELQLPGGCDDGACPPPQVLRAADGSPVVSSSLPGVLDELLLGGHAALRPLPGLTLGLTGYGALLGLPGPLTLQRWSRWPGPGLLGAVGLSSRWAAGPWVLALEAARSLDGGGGGFGAVQRTAWRAASHQAELSLRAYDAHFAAVHGRPVAASDLDGGQAARNELGARLTWRWRPGPGWSAWLRLDTWTNPEAEAGGHPAWTPGLAALARVDLGVRPWLTATAFGAASLRRAAGAACAEGTGEEAAAAVDPCAEQRFKAGARLALALAPLAPAVVLHLWLARVASGGRWRTDGLAQVEAAWTVREGLRLAAGARGLVAGLGDAASVEVRAVGWLEAGWSPGAGVRARVRYELWTWPLGPAPSPNPEHRGLLDLTVAWEGGRPGAPAPALPSGASPPRSSR